MEKILSSHEVRSLVGQIISIEKIHSLPASEYALLLQSVDIFLNRFEKSYQQFKQDVSGELAYRDIILYYRENVLSKIRKYLSVDGPDRKAARAIECMLYPSYMEVNARSLLSSRWRKFRQIDSQEEVECPKFDRPIFIVSAPRSGSTLLFETLSKFKEIWTIGRESHDIEKDIPYLHPVSHNYTSNRLTSVSPDIADNIKKWFTRQLRNRNGVFFTRSASSSTPVRFLEKTPKNALRIPFWKKVFPDAKFIFLYRDPHETISSMLEGWRSNRFLAYRNLPGWPYKEWHFLLPQGWKKYADRPLAEIATYQWNAANQTILDDLHTLPKEDWGFVTYKKLVQAPKETVQKITEFAEIEWDNYSADRFSGPLPLSSMVVSPPSTNKWKSYNDEIMPFFEMAESLAKRVSLIKHQRLPARISLNA